MSDSEKEEELQVMVETEEKEEDGKQEEDGKKKEKAKKKEDDDGPERDWDYCLVFRDVEPPMKDGFIVPADDPKMKKWEKIQQKRRELVKKLRHPEVGLHVTRKKSSDKKAIFALITASDERLDAQAEHMELTMKLKEENGGGWTSFETEKKHLFVGSTDPEENFYRKIERIFLVESIITGRQEYGGAGENLDELVSDGVVSMYFPLHTEEKRKELLHIWANPKKAFTFQPLDAIRDYFGEEIALYFAWLGTYTIWLAIASAFGFIATIFWFIDKFSVNPWAVWASSIYAIFLSLWATFFLEYWKRKNNTLNYKWGTMEYKEREVERVSFYGELMTGAYTNGTWVPLDPDADYSFGKGSDLPKKKYYPTKVRRAKMVVGFPIMATMITVVVIATFAVLSFRLFMQTTANIEPFGGFVGSTANAITILIMNIVWKWIATKLTEWENHRTQSEYINNLISKIFLFYFVNSYTSLFYIAFVKAGFVFFGRSDLVDGCNFVVFEGQLIQDREEYREKVEDRLENISPGCVDEVTIQLLTILAVNMFIGQAREVLLPWIMGKVKLYLLVRNDEVEKDDVSIWERDSKKPIFPGTFDEYSEMVIQYGYITLFAAAFPLAPLMAMLNNVVEIRTDALKLLTSHPRPNYAGAQSIGTWYQILEIVGIIAVITNCMMIGLSFSTISTLFPSDTRAFAALGIAAILEHVILFMKFIISVLVPDMPSDIKKQMAREEFIKDQTLKSLRGVIQKTKWEDNMVDRDEDASDDEEKGGKGEDTIDLA